jgi:hypothetical protein
MRIFSLLLIVTLLSGCRHLATTSSSPTKLALRIADADNIVVTSFFAQWDKEHEGMRFVIKGQTARKIVRAVSGGERLSMGVGDYPSWNLQFYRGTNYLDYISFEGPIYRVYDCKGNEGDWRRDWPYSQYGDDAKVLQSLDDYLTELAKRP